MGMVQINQILGNIDLWLHSVWQPHPLGMGMITPLLELCHFILRSSPATENGPQAARKVSHPRLNHAQK